MGAGVVVSQYIGAKDKRGLRAAVHTALTIAGILGLVLTVAGIFLSRQLLIWMQTPADVLEDSVRYLQVYSGGLICSVVYNMATGILNAAGNSRRPLLYLGVASVVNIALDILLIEGFHMGVEGAAIATDASSWFPVCWQWRSLCVLKRTIGFPCAGFASRKTWQFES